MTKDQLLQAPQEGLEFPSYGQQTPPFELQGGFYTSLPQILSGAKVYLRKPEATKDTSNLLSYFAPDNYQEIALKGENILISENKTTLRFNQKSFNLVFGLLHRSIWAPSGIQVSLLFQSDTRTFFHICIPVVIGGSERSENQFLASWLGRRPIPGAGLSLNELVNFRGSESDVRFATLEFCLKYNVRAQPNGQDLFDLRPYTFCIFRNPIFINQSCPDWLRNEQNLDAAPRMLKDVTPPIPGAYRIRDFNEFFNGWFSIHKQILTQIDPRVISNEEHFENTRTQNAVKPAYFKVHTASLTGRPLSNKQTSEGVRGLQNVKCYPIDLVNQVDEGGNIYIDQTSNKPVNVKDAMTVSKTGKLPDELAIDSDEALDASIKAAEAASRARFWIAFAVIMLILVAFLVTIIVFAFRGTSFSNTEFVPANTPVVAAAAPVAAAVAAPVPAPAP